LVAETPRRLESNARDVAVDTHGRAAGDALPDANRRGNDPAKDSQSAGD
jgi:hypothetical protein